MIWVEFAVPLMVTAAVAFACAALILGVERDASPGDAPPSPEAEAERLHAALATVARNLVDLRDSEEAATAFARIEDADRPYDPARLAAATEARRALDGLLADYVAVSKVVDGAYAMATSRRPDAEVVAAMVRGNTVRLATTSRPVRERRLLESAETTPSDTPGNVLAAMEARFDEVRATIVALAEDAPVGPARTEA